MLFVRLNHLEWKEEMTDTLKALRDQAWQYASTQTPSGFVGGAWHKYRDAFEEKFAELIVRECADIASINQFQPDEVGKYIKKHFGVEK